ncbi:hypothetical protein N9S06_05680 [Gammaproteobacteria bacterium]|nr:hypothetical protein [Gammaproteobacteria bacterium]
MNNLKIDFKDLFDLLMQYDYVAIKLDPEFPKYEPGQDLDIYCRDVEEISKIIITFLNIYVNKHCHISVSKNKNNVHIDLMNGQEIHYRFDIHRSLPAYEQIKIKASLFDVVIESSSVINRDQCMIKVPNQIDESVLRYIEFQEYFAARPDKIKHVDYILASLGNSDKEMNKFLLRLHHFIQPSTQKFHKKSFLFKVKENFIFYYESFLKVFSILKRDGLGALVKKIRSRIFKK